MENMRIYLRLAESLENKYVKNLVDILNNDKKLAKSLKSDKKLLSCAEFIAYNKQWSKKNKAQIFAIIMNQEAIGLISLSRIDKVRQTASIGYWIASKCWNKGYASGAFKQILNLARDNNINLVSGSISKENKASMAIWQKHNVKFEEKGSNVIPQIYL